MNRQQCSVNGSPDVSKAIQLIELWLAS